MSVRTRFAPSPTGFMHVGGIRTALFAWLVARQNKGQFVLRIEDTDKNREIAGAEKHIMESLRALGIDWDEGPGTEGSFAPYSQSKRLDIYKKWAKKLVDSDRAYADPYTPQEVQGFREQAQKDKQPFLYRNHRPDNPPEWDGTQPLRFKSDAKPCQWHDEVMGKLGAGAEAIDDFIIMKSDGYPTYNFAHIVDDTEMQITHVIRGQEFISSMPNYLNLYEALGLTPPIFATLPHILNEQGNKKLGKRDGAKDVMDYIKEGFLPDALVSFIATLGWNDGTDQDVYTREELVKKFSLQRVGRSGAHFDQRRLLWTNGYFIRQLPLDELYKKTAPYWPRNAGDQSDPYKKRVLSTIQERLKYFGEIPELTNFFFDEPTPQPKLITSDKGLSKVAPGRLSELLKISRTELEKSSFTPNDLQERLNTLLKKTGEKPSILFGIIRIAVTWAPASPALNETLAVLGKEKTIYRISTAYATLMDIKT